MKNINDFVSDLNKKVSVIEKFDFERIDAVFDAMHFAFYPDGFDEDIFDVRFNALWTLFLNSAGWTEDEYWEYWHSHKDEFVCDCCKEKELKEAEMKESDTAKLDPKVN